MPAKKKFTVMCSAPFNPVYHHILNDVVGYKLLLTDDTGWRNTGIDIISVNGVPVPDQYKGARGFHGVTPFTPSMCIRDGLNVDDFEIVNING